MSVTPGTIAVTEGAGKTLDTAAVTVGSNIVQREIVSLGSPSTPGNYGEVTADNAAIILPVAAKVTQLQSAVINFSSSGVNTLIAGAAGQTVRVYRFFLVTSGTTNLTMQDTAGSPNVYSGPVPINSGSFVLDFQSEPWFTTIAGNGFAMNSSAGVQVSGTIYYTQS